MAIGSVEELKKYATSDVPEGFDLHTVNEITIKHPESGEIMNVHRSPLALALLIFLSGACGAAQPGSVATAIVTWPPDPVSTMSASYQKRAGPPEVMTVLPNSLSNPGRARMVKSWS